MDIQTIILMKRLYKNVTKAIRRMVGTEKLSRQIEPQIAEMHYATLFHDTIIDSEWFKYKSLSLGTWAIDYGTAYVIYRVLDMMHPENLLEFGLGQSSKIVHQYSNYYRREALTIEHDEKFVKFFLNETNDKYPLHIEMVDLEKKVYKGHDTLSYKNIKGMLGETKYNFIFVDGPFGTNTDGHDYFYSRTEILDILDTNLAESFCVIIHDYNRIGEQNTIDDVLKKLEENGIRYYTSVYSATKSCMLICSADLQFLTTV